MDATLAIAPSLPPALPPPLPVAPPLPLQAPRVWRSLGVIGIYFAMQLAIGFAFALLISVIAGFVYGLRGQLRTAVGTQVRDLIMQPDMQAVLIMLTLLGAGLWAIWYVRRSWPRLWSVAQPPGFGVVLPVSSAFFALAVVAGLTAPLIGGWMTQLFAGKHAVTQDIAQLGTQTMLGLRIPLALLVVSVGPLVEELLFRGLLLSALLQRWGAGWAALLSSLAFVAVHIPGMEMQWYALPDLLLLALVLAWLRLQSRSIWPSVLTHALNNSMAVAFWFVAMKPPG